MRLYIALLLCTVLAVQDMKQGTLYEEQLGKLQQSKLGRTILQMIQASSSVEFDFNSLFQAIDDLSASIGERKTEEADSLEQDYQQYLIDNDYYTNQVTEYSTEVAQHQVDSDTLRQARNQLQQSLITSNAELALVKQQLAEVEQQIKQITASNARKQQQYDGGISVIDQVINLLTTLKENPSFAEITPEDIKVSTATLTRRLNNLSDRTFVFEPLTRSLIELASGGFEDQESLHSVLKLLRELRDDILPSKEALQIATDREVADAQALVDTYNTQIAFLADEVIPQLQTDIETKTAQLETKAKLLDDAQKNLSTAEQNLSATEERWVNRQSQNRDLEDKYNLELATLSQALVALERGGISR